MSKQRIRIAMADDHPVVRRGLHAFLAAQPEFDVVAECGDGESLMVSLRGSAVDVILLDLLMPGGGVALVQQIAEVAPEAHVLVLTSSEDARLLFDVLHAGATSALLKDSTPEQLRDAIVATHRGERVLQARVALLVANMRAQAPLRPTLSTREREVLRLIAEGLGNADIAARLGIGIKTVKTHVSHLLLKLDVDDRTQAAVRALRESLV
jgi:NarL family two-component system response regulator LiaR